MNLRTALLLVGLPLGLVALGFTIPAANAQTNSWTSSSIGFWQDAASWSLGLPPDSTQSMLITNAGNNTVLIDSSTASGYSNTMTVSDLILAGQAGSENMLLVDNIGSNPPLHILNSLIVNAGGTLLAIDSALLVDNAAGGAVDVESAMALSGTNFLSGGLYVGFSTNSAATVSVIDGQTAFTNGYMTIGFYGSAQVTFLGGTLQTEDYISVPNGMFVGFGPGSQGTLSVLAGTLLVPEHLSLGEDPGSTGQLWLNGGQLIANNNPVSTGSNDVQPLWFNPALGVTTNYLITIGGNGAGQATVSNGQLAAFYLIVGDALGSSGTLTVAGGTVSISGAMVVAQGQSATGSVFITGGQLTVTNQGVSVSSFGIGQQSLTIGGFGAGQMTLSNGSLLAQSVIVGDCENSQGTLTIAGGTVSIASSLTAGANAYIGTSSNANASGTIDITGGSLTVTNQSGTGLLTIGQQGNGSLAQNGGLVQVDQLTIAMSGSSLPAVYPATTNLFFSGVGQVTLSNGSFFAESVTLGGNTNCRGTFSIAGGTVSVFSNILVGAGSNSLAVIQISGGTLNVTNKFDTAQLVVGLAGAGTFTQSGGVVTVDQLLATNATYNVYTNRIVEPLWAIITNGIGSTFSLGSGVFNAQSATINNAQTFFVGDGTDAATYHLLGGIHSFANGIEITSNAVLSGCGTINGSVLVDPGGLVQADCGGTLTVVGIVTNNGTIIADGGTTIDFRGVVVGSGTIISTNGNVQFFGATILTSSSPPSGGSTSGAGAYSIGSNVTVCATANVCYSFVNWTDQSSNVVSTLACYNFAVPSNETLVANFAPISLSTITASSPPGSGTTSGGGTVLCGSVVTVCETPDLCYGFVNWTVNGHVVSTSACYSFTVPSNETLVANFVPISSYTIITTNSPAGSGVTTGGGNIACGSNATLCAVGNSCYSFVNWTDQNSNVVSTSACYTFPVVTNVTLVAHFAVNGGATGGSLTSLWTFLGGIDGAQPEGTLIQGGDGYFYGTTFGSGSGPSPYGTVFRISPGGGLTNLWSFTGGNDGVNPGAGLVQGNDGNFYGTTYGSWVGPSGLGTVFRISAGGSLTNLWSFTGGTDGANPYDGLVQGSDGNFYGTTVGSGAGPSGYGTVFRISPGGSLTTLWSFTNGLDGANSYATLAQGVDGNFYGTTESGGANGWGTVFSISPTGALSNLWEFTGCSDGAYPAAGLVQGSDGNFYGTTYGSGSGPFGYGTVFRISPDGSLTTLWSFANGVDGAYSYAALVQGVDGNFYGTTVGSGSGPSGNGTVFELSVPLHPPANEISAIQIGGSNVVLTLHSVAGETYQLQFSNSMNPTNWTNVGGASVTKSIGGPLSLTNFGAAHQPLGFYRFDITP